MKKALFVAALATLMTASCQKTEVINQTSGPRMSFTTEINKLTKAVGTIDAENDGQKNLEAQDFSVWAFADVAGGDFENSTLVDDETYIYDKMENLHIECKKASDNTATPVVLGEWSTGKEYYWPGKDKNLMFFAVSADGNWLRPQSPASCPVDITLGNDNTNHTMKIEGFKVENKPIMDPNDETKVKKTAANEDLMVAEYVIQDQDKKVVDLVFHHTLAKVQFQFKTITVPDVTVYVQKLVVEDLETTGTLNVTFTPNDTEKLTFDWGDLPINNSTTLADFTDDWETPIITTGDNADPDFPAKIENQTPSDDDKKAMKLTATGGTTDPAQIFTTWLVLPQKITGKKVKITYLINERQYTSVFALDHENIPNAEWACNQYIRYTITLAPNVMTFIPEVDDWDTITIPEMQN